MTRQAFVVLAGMASAFGFINGTLPAPVAAALQAQAPAVPRPSPFPGSSPSTSRPPDPGPPAARTAAPAPLPPIEAPRGDQAPEGTPVYPSAEFIDSYDAGSGQRYYLYGTNAPYADVVAFYKNTLRNGGRELYKTPPMQQFDLGRFQEGSMAYPPSVVVKDYTSNGSAGYLMAAGATEKRYRTVIQIVPPTVVGR
jgi:hypothetical protein